VQVRPDALPLPFYPCFSDKDAFPLHRQFSAPNRIEILIQALVGMIPQFLPSVFHALAAEPISFFLTVRVLPRRVIHVVGPVWRGLKDAEIEVRGTITGIDGESRTTSCAIKPSKINGDVCSGRSDALFSTAQGRMQRWALRAERMASQRQG